MERCAKTAAEMENGTIVEEGDAEDQELEIELGKPANALIFQNTRRLNIWCAGWKNITYLNCL